MHPRLILEVSRLRVERGRTAILRGVDWRVARGEHWVILGANGSGKTSLLKALTGFLSPTAGEIFVLGQRYGASDWRELRFHLGVVTSSFTAAIPPAEPALDTVVSGKFAQLDLWHAGTRADRDAAQKLLRFVGLAKIANREWAYLSQGERQRVLIARALMARPRLLILDEPCAGLDPVAREHFLAFVERLARRKNAPALVLVTHHVEEITPAFTHALLLRADGAHVGPSRPDVWTAASPGAARRPPPTRFRPSVNPLPDIIEGAGLTSVWTYLALFLAASLLMVWRLDALLKHGLEGTALGTLVMPYCSGLGNLLFVWIIADRKGPGQEVLTNCLVNNVTNLTLVLALPALVWGLEMRGGSPAKKDDAKKKPAAAAGRASSETEHELNRLSLLLTLAAVVFFSGVTWALGADGKLDSREGLVLVALFLFWQCFQVFDVMKHNVRQRTSFGALFYFDVGLVLLGAWALYTSLDWLVAWLSGQQGGFISAANLGWLSGWLMVLPNALLAFYYAARARADIAYASQVGDGHICIPLCVGLSAAIAPLPVPKFFETGLAILVGAAIVHALCVLLARGLPRWMGWPLAGAYAWFVTAGLM
jgi:cation:H+ antiporter